MKIVVDTREQLPLFSRDVIRRKLHVADYTTELLENIFHIERKSGADLYGSLTRGHVRFRNMLIRAERCGITVALFVECSRKDFINKKFPGGNRCLGFPSSGLDRMLNTMEAKYKVEIVWAKTRRGCVRKTKMRLKKEEAEFKRPYIKGAKVYFKSELYER